jgi:hypothetical protein
MFLTRAACAVKVKSALMPFRVEVPQCYKGRIAQTTCSFHHSLIVKFHDAYIGGGFRSSPSTLSLKLSMRE